MQNTNKLTTQQAVAHLAKFSNHGRGRKAIKPPQQKPFQLLLRQEQDQQLGSLAVLGYN